MPIYSLDGEGPDLPEDDAFWVAPDAHVIGRVKIGRDVGIWFGAVIRGDNELVTIGEGTNIQEGAMLHTDPGYPMVLGPDCTIGHHAILHGCTLGAGTLVGMGATLLNGAKLGSGCLVGANALVTENKTFPDNSLIVGSPAKAVRELDAAATARLRQTAAGYVRNLRRFKAGLRLVR